MPAAAGAAEIDIAAAAPQIRPVTEDTLSEPRLTPAAAKAKAEREARQAAALRANLRRRKEQAREREAQPAATREAEPPHNLYPDISDSL